MSLNRDALKKMKEQSSQGNDDFLDQKKFTEEGIDFRVIPPLESMEGLPGFPVIKLWINNKPYISPETFGGECPYDTVLAEVKALDDKELLAIIGKGPNSQISKKTEFWVPGFELKEVDDEHQFGAFRYLVISKMAYNKLMDAILSKVYSKIKSDDGILDVKLGHPMTFSKTGSKLETQYNVSVYPTPLAVPAELMEKIKDKDPVKLAEKLNGDNTYQSLVDKMRAHLGLTDGIERKAETAPKKSLKALIKDSAEDKDENKNLDSDDLPF